MVDGFVDWSRNTFFRGVVLEQKLTVMETAVAKYLTDRQVDRIGKP